jgi:fructose 1,6-bisphosphate aldolase/phosphatase
MKTTISVIKADIGSIGGHLRPSRRMLDAVRLELASGGRELLLDHHISTTGDDVAILMTHAHGVGDTRVHELAWRSFLKGAAAARAQGLYAAGQDLLKDSFSGNVRGMGPAVCEMEVVEREGEPFLVFAADKTDPGAYNLPLYLAFADPMHSSGLLLSSELGKGFRFTVMDVAHSSGDRVVELETPGDLHELAVLLRDPERYVVESVRSRATGELAAVVSTTRLHNIAGKYTGKDDPVMIVRTQKQFPATGEILSPFAIGHHVAGGMRGSHQLPLMPIQQGGEVSWFDGPPIVSCAAYCVHEGRLTEPLDAFAQPFWDEVRYRVAKKALDMRRQGFFGAAMLPMDELEYTGIKERLARLDGRFRVRNVRPVATTNA